MFRFSMMMISFAQLCMIQSKCFPFQENSSIDTLLLRNHFENVSRLSKQNNKSYRQKSVQKWQHPLTRFRLPSGWRAKSHFDLLALTSWDEHSSSHKRFMAANKKLCVTTFSPFLIRRVIFLLLSRI
jgi:hypothetical protein